MGTVLLYEGESHKITTDGKIFFLYRKSDSEWCLRDSKPVDRDAYEDVLGVIRSILSMDMPEEEKILKICESGFFRISNL